MKRRTFLERTVPLVFLPALPSPGAGPVVVSTWSPNVKANAAAWQVLERQGSALDAVHTGVQVPEADPEDQSVGYGGLPDRDGKVTVDSCIMDHEGNMGSVVALEHILHPVSVARMVMEKTPHVMLAGAGALQFALEQGFPKTNLLTPDAKTAWKNWKKEKKYDQRATIDNIQERIKKNHDTIGMLALDAMGNLSGACSTSGMAFKLPGRVGDSPIVGAGLFVDNSTGAATATGNGEEIIRVAGSHLVVELMRQGRSPEEACKGAIERLLQLRGAEKLANAQICFIALRKDGATGCYALRSGFTMAQQKTTGVAVIEAGYLIS